MLAPQFRPAREVVLRRDRGHFALEADDVGAELGLLCVVGMLRREGGWEREAEVERP